MNSIRPRTLSDYLSSIRRRKLLIAVTAAVVVAASLIAIKRLPNIYESSTFILVDWPSSEMVSSEHPTADLQHRLSTVRQQVTSRTRLQTLIDKHGLYRDMAGQPEDSIIARMRSEIDVEVTSSRPDATEAFTISYRARDPLIARAVTYDLADQLIQENVQNLQSEASGESDVLRQRAIELSAELHQLEMKSPWLINLKEDSPAVPIQTGGGRGGPAPEAVRTHAIAVGGIKDQQYKLEQQIADLDRRIADQQRIVERQKKNPAVHDNPAYGGLVAKRAELQGQKDNLINRQGLTDKHPRVIGIQDQIAAVNRAIADMQREESGRVTQSAEERELASLHAERNRIKVELEVAGRELDRQAINPPAAPRAGGTAPATPVIPRDAGSARLAQDYLGLKQTYKDVTSKVQNAELKRQTIGSGKVEKFQVLDEANLPQVPVWPNRKIMGLIALVLGLALGLGLALLLEARMFPYLHDIRDVEYYTNLPLLAAIPTTLTDGEKAAARRRLGIKVILGTAAALIATAALTEVFTVAHLFEVIKK